MTRISNFIKLKFNMKRILNIGSILHFVWTLIMLIFIFSGKIVFGQGMGDMGYVVLLVILQTIFGYVFFLNIRSKIGFPLLMTILLVVCVLLFTLKMTIYRGLEYPWNGNVFFE